MIREEGKGVGVCDSNRISTPLINDTATNKYLSLLQVVIMVRQAALRPANWTTESNTKPNVYYTIHYRTKPHGHRL